MAVGLWLLAIGCPKKNSTKPLRITANAKHVATEFQITKEVGQSQLAQSDDPSLAHPSSPAVP